MLINFVLSADTAMYRKSNFYLRKFSAYFLACPKGSFLAQAQWISSLYNPCLQHNTYDYLYANNHTYVCKMHLNRVYDLEINDFYAIHVCNQGLLKYFSGSWCNILNFSNLILPYEIRMVNSSECEWSGIMQKGPVLNDVIIF